MFGLTHEEYQILNNLVFIPLKKSGAKVWVFGSRARGDQKNTSDVDILYTYPSGNFAPSGLIYSVRCDLDESRFPYKLDLVQSDQLAEAYRSGVDKDKIEV